MKKKIFVTMLAMTMVAAMLVGCGAKKDATATGDAATETEVATEVTTETDASKNDDAVVEEPSKDVVSDEETVEEKEPATEEKEKLPEDNLANSYSASGLDYQYPDYENKYAAMIRESLGMDESVYRGTCITTNGDKWGVLYVGEEDQKTFYNSGIGEDIMTDDEVKAFLNDIQSITNSLYDEYNAGNFPGVDLDEDGEFSKTECYVVASFVAAQNGLFGIGGVATY